MKIILDASAWIEYLEGSEQGKQVKELLEGQQLFTTTLTFAEIISKALRKKLSNTPVAELIRTKSTIIPVSEIMAYEGAKIHAGIKEKKPKFALADGICLAAARMHGAKVLTFDQDFSGFTQVLLLKK